MPSAIFPLFGTSIGLNEEYLLRGTLISFSQKEVFIFFGSVSVPIISAAVLSCFSLSK